MAHVLLLAVWMPSPAQAACTVQQLLPADGAVVGASPTFTWSGSGCVSARVVFSPSCTFNGDTVASKWRASTSFALADSRWDDLSSGAWEDGVCWRVQGQSADGAKDTTGSRDVVPAGNGDAAEADAFFVGESGFDWAGTAVAWIGDLDQDGNDDLLVGAPFDDQGGPDAGAAYLFYGPVSGHIDLSDADAKLLGESGGALAGAAVSGAGDVNGDGAPDYLIGAYGAGAGFAYLLTEPVHGLVDLGDVGHTIPGARMEGERLGDAAGAGVLPAGDLDGDGFDDVMVAAPSRDEGAGSPTTGAVYILYGPIFGDVALGCTFDGSCSGAVTKFAGSATKAVGDVDGDGFGYFSIGTSGFNDVPAGYDHLGVARLIPGPFSGEFTSSAETASAQFFGEGADDGAGSAVESGDFDGDGVTDFLVGAAGAGAGTLAIFFGPVSGDYVLSDADVTITSDDAGAFGSTLAVGDIDDDGALDLVVGAPNVDINVGAVYVFTGPFAPAVFTSDAADLQLDGELDTFFGSDLAFGDGDGDGRLDLLVGIVGDNTGGFRAGGAALYEDPLP